MIQGSAGGVLPALSTLKVRDPRFSDSFREFNLSVAGSVTITDGDKNLLTNVVLLGNIAAMGGFFFPSLLQVSC